MPVYLCVVPPDAYHSGRHCSHINLLFSVNVSFGSQYVLQGCGHIRAEAVCCVLPLLKNKTVGQMVLDMFASPWILVYTVKRPVCLLISMIGGVCQLPTVMRQHLSRTVIWRLLSLISLPYFNDQTSQVFHVGQAPSALSTAVVRSCVSWRDCLLLATATHCNGQAWLLMEASNQTDWWLKHIYYCCTDAMIVITGSADFKTSCISIFTQSFKWQYENSVTMRRGSPIVMNP